MPAFQDAFISYGRADSKAFVIALKEQVKVKGLGNIWLDQDDIPAATDWQQRIDEAIGRSHQFIYVISPSAMASPYCKLELSLACQYGKRIIPLLHVGGDSNAWAAVDREGAAAVRLLNWIFYREGIDDPVTGFLRTPKHRQELAPILEIVRFRDLAMKAYEFPAQVTQDGQLRLPEAALAQLDGEQVVRIIVLIQEPVDGSADQAWSTLATEQFLAGYSAEDAIYDAL